MRRELPGILRNPKDTLWRWVEDINKILQESKILLCTATHTQRWEKSASQAIIKL